MKWILQEQGHSLSDFINMTPIIKHLFYTYKNKVRVLFEDQYIRKAYEGHHMIECLEEAPDLNPFAATSLVHDSDSPRKYIDAFKSLLNIPYMNDMKPFIKHGVPNHNGNYCLIMCCSTNELEELDDKWPNMDDLVQFARKALARGYGLVFTGSKEDAIRAKRVTNLCEVRVGNIRESLDLIAGAGIIISNDNDLTHAAGALDKQMFIMLSEDWGELNSGQNTFYSRLDNQKEDFENWIK